MHEYAIRITNHDGKQYLVPLSIDDESRAKGLADMYSEPRYHDVNSDVIASYEVIYREVGEWNEYRPN